MKPFKEIDLSLEFVFLQEKDSIQLKIDYLLFSFTPNNIDPLTLKKKLDEIEGLYKKEISKFNKDSNQIIYRKVKEKELERKFTIGISSKWDKEVIEEVIRCFMYYNVGFYQISK